MKAPEKDVSPLLRAAMAAQRQGAVRDARRLYEQALRAAPRHPDALHLLGLTWLDDGQAERGLQLIRRAIAYRPDYLEAINNIAIELAKLDRHAEAQGFLEKALRLNEAQPDVHYNLGRSLNALGRYQDALARYDRAVVLQPGHHEAWNNRGITLHALKDLDGALASYDRALALKPDFHEAWTGRGICLHDLKRSDEALDSYDNAIAANPEHFEAWLHRGYALLELKQFDAVVSALDRAATIKPENPDVWTARGIALNELKRFDEAIADSDQALLLSPNHMEAWVARCWIFHCLGRFDEAMMAIQKALSIRPDHTIAWSNQGMVLSDLRRMDEAIASYNRALALNPEHADSYLGRAYALLALGRLAEGWRDHEYRWTAWRDKAIRPAGVTAPEWAGEDLSGRNILVYSEQGLGDTIQFSRYLPMMQARGARITFLAPGILRRLLAPGLPGIALVGDPAEVGPQDFQIPTLSLPFHFGTEVATIPCAVPYLAAEPDLVAKWRARLGTHGFRVGIAWQGNPAGTVDIGRSIPLAMFAALADLPGLRLISLQKGFGTEQLVSLPDGMVVETLGGDFDSGSDAFVDTAAVMQNLDLIITSDTSIVHLAGALARPIWVALKYAPDWRWLQDRADSPWYPTMRLFRQAAPGEWGGVFRDIRRALEYRGGSEEMR